MVRGVSVLLFVLGAAILAGCDGHSGPVSPTPTHGPGSPGPVSITIGGATSLNHPGDTGQLTATVTFSDLTTREVTAETMWVGQEDLIAMSGPGLITAVRYGTGTVFVRYLTVTATAWIRVAPPARP